MTGDNDVMIDVVGLHKTFVIPSVRRETVREHFFGLFTPRRFERLVVLDGVDVQVRRGESVGVMGRNGSGKSTLLKVISGLYEADRGRVRLGGSLTCLLELGVGWNMELNAIDNIELVGTVMGLSLRECREAVAEILEFAELERFAQLELKHYSSGMASRLAYAVAFRAVRDILVLDEIFAVGDAGFRAKCEGRYAELRAKGQTIVLVSHDPRVVTEYCDRAVLIDGGRVALEGAAADVARAYAERVGGA